MLLKIRENLTLADELAGGTLDGVVKEAVGETVSDWSGRCRGGEAGFRGAGRWAGGVVFHPALRAQG